MAEKYPSEQDLQDLNDEIGRLGQELVSFIAQNSPITLREDPSMHLGNTTPLEPTVHLNADDVDKYTSASLPHVRTDQREINNKLDQIFTEFHTKLKNYPHSQAKTLGSLYDIAASIGLDLEIPGTTTKLKDEIKASADPATMPSNDFITAVGDHEGLFTGTKEWLKIKGGRVLDPRYDVVSSDPSSVKAMAEVLAKQCLDPSYASHPSVRKFLGQRDKIVDVATTVIAESLGITCNNGDILKDLREAMKEIAAGQTADLIATTLKAKGKTPEEISGSLLANTMFRLACKNNQVLNNGYKKLGQFAKKASGNNLLDDVKDFIASGNPQNADEVVAFINYIWDGTQPQNASPFSRPSPCPQYQTYGAGAENAKEELKDLARNNPRNFATVIHSHRIDANAVFEMGAKYNGNNLNPPLSIKAYLSNEITRSSCVIAGAYFENRVQRGDKDIHDDHDPNMIAAVVHGTRKKCTKADKTETGVLAPDTSGNMKLDLFDSSTELTKALYRGFRGLYDKMVAMLDKKFINMAQSKGLTLNFVKWKAKDKGKTEAETEEEMKHFLEGSTVIKQVVTDPTIINLRDLNSVFRFMKSHTGASPIDPDKKLILWKSFTGAEVTALTPEQTQIIEAFETDFQDNFSALKTPLPMRAEVDFQNRIVFHQHEAHRHAQSQQQQQQQQQQHPQTNTAPPFPSGGNTQEEFAYLLFYTQSPGSIDKKKALLDFFVGREGASAGKTSFTQQEERLFALTVTSFSSRGLNAKTAPLTDPADIAAFQTFVGNGRNYYNTTVVGVTIP